MPEVSSFSTFRSLEVTLRHTILGNIPLDMWSAFHRDFYLTTHNTHKRQTTMLPEGFEPAILASERPQTCTIERVAIGIGVEILIQYYFVPPFLSFSFYDFIHTAFPLSLTHYYSCCLPCLSVGINIAKADNSTLSLVSSLAYCWWQGINNV